MSRLDVSIRGLRRVEEDSRRSQPRQRLLEAFALLALAALATGYSRERMMPQAVLGTLADFGAQPLGQQTAAQTLVVRNGGRSELRIDKVGITAEGTPTFFLPEDDCSRAALAAGETCKIGVAFLPSEPGASSATLTIEDNSPNSPHIVVLGGTGLAKADDPRGNDLPEPHVDPTEAALSADVGAEAVQEVTVRNAGNAPVTLVEVAFSGDSGDFAVDSSGCAGGPLMPGRSCALRATFKPLRAGAQTATLTVAHDATQLGPLLVSLKGQGIGPRDGYCCIDRELVKLDEAACKQRAGEFALDPNSLAFCNERPPPLAPRPPERLWPGVPQENEPQGLDDCRAVVLHWSPVESPREPIDYLVTLENGRGKRGAERPSDWGEIAREVVPAAQQVDVSAAIGSILDPKRADPRGVVAPPLETREMLRRWRDTAERVAGERGGRDRGVAEMWVPAVVSFPVFRWRVSARDVAGDEGPASDWFYFRCVPPQIR